MLIDQSVSPQKCDAHTIEILARTFAKNLVAQGFDQRDLAQAAALLLEQALVLSEEMAKPSSNLKVVSGKRS